VRAARGEGSQGCDGEQRCDTARSEPAEHEGIREHGYEPVRWLSVSWDGSSRRVI
jgi:hypothetical protein